MVDALALAVFAVGFYLWQWLVKKFQMNGIIAVLITIIAVLITTAVISLLVTSVVCIFDSNC